MPLLRSSSLTRAVAAPSGFWSGRMVIVTGASSGLGWALAEHLAARGARLALLARRAERLAALALRITQTGADAVFEAVDVRDAAALRSAVQECERRLAPCDVLIASAGVHRYSPGGQFSAAAAGEVFATNIIGVSNSVGAVLPGMVERRRGHLVAVASLAGMLGLPEVGAYSASKAAVITLMQSLRVDLHRLGIRVTTVCPGFIDTPFVADHERRYLKWMVSAPEAARRIARAIERGRAEYCFPWQSWLLVRVARALPAAVYAQLVTHLHRRRDANLPKETSIGKLRPGARPEPRS